MHNYLSDKCFQINIDNVICNVKKWSILTGVDPVFHETINPIYDINS